jgi:hypothetical protein
MRKPQTQIVACMGGSPAKFKWDADMVPDFACKMKRTTLVRSLSCIYLVMFVVIMVCLPSRRQYTRADGILAHRQCARNANALRSDEGISANHLNGMMDLLLTINSRGRKLAVSRLRHKQAPS